MNPTLRYFDCRGRAQPMRFFLAHHQVSFTDERVPFTDGWKTWAEMKAEKRLSGPFGKLPVLVWDEHTLSQTNLIASFLQQRIADTGDYSVATQTQYSLSEDLGQLYILLNLDLFAPGAQLQGFADRTLASLVEAFTGYEAMLRAGERPFDPLSKWSVAAFWLHEVWQLSQTLFGERAQVLISERTHLAATIENVSADCADLCARNAPPTCWSARPDEPLRLPAVQKEIAMA